MSLFFQYPALFGLLALAGVPLLVHLLSRAKPPEYRFSNIDFLRRVMRRTARFRRPKDWLLLSLRTLALLALAAAFISPFLISRNSSLPGGRTTSILLIDRSASMAAREAAASRFDAATAAAAKYLDEASPSAANIIWIDAEPDAVFPEPGSNIPFLNDLLNRTGPSSETGALSSAFDLALRQLSSVEGKRELVIISDFQASAWKTFDPAVPEDITILTRKVASSAPPNLSVTRLLAQPATPVAGQEITLLATVRNFSSEAIRTELTLDADGSRQSQTIDISPSGETETAFTLKPAHPGPLAITASIGSDSFPADDARHTVLRVRDSIRIARQGDSDPAIRKWIGSLPWLESSDTARPGDAVVISSWNGDKAGELVDQARKGVSILIHDPVSLPSLPGVEITGPFAIENSAAGWQIVPDENHPANRLFKTGDFGNPFAGVFRERLKLPADLPGTRRIATYTDGVPAILEIPAEAAPILFFNLPLSPPKSDWSEKGTFLPALAEILLRTQPRQTTSSGEALPGGFLSHTSTDTDHAGTIRLIGPDGKPIATDEKSSGQGSVWQSLSPASPGIHQWQSSGQTIEATAVNFPESESNLVPLESPPSFGKRGSSDDSLSRHAALSRGLALWPWLALAAILLLVSESFVHLRGTFRSPSPPSA